MHVIDECNDSQPARVVCNVSENVCARDKNVLYEMISFENVEGHIHSTTVALMNKISSGYKML